MKSNIMRTFVISILVVFVGAGVSMADGWKGDDGKRGNAYGHSKHREYYHYQHYAPPRPVYVERHYRPVVVERHYYPAPVRYVAPAPSGFFFGMSVVDAGSWFGFGVGRR